MRIGTTQVTYYKQRRRVIHEPVGDGDCNSHYEIKYGSISSLRTNSGHEQRSRIVLQ